MAKRSRKTQTAKNDYSDYIAVASTDDFEMAQEYKELLLTTSIPAVIREVADDDIGTASFVVMVPERNYEEANNLIESQDIYDAEYDFITEDKDQDYYDMLDDDNY